MAYPTSLDTFLGTTAAGTSLLTSPDHALDHRTLGSAAAAIETVLGTTAGTSVLKNFTAGELAEAEGQLSFGANKYNLGSGTLATNDYLKYNGTSIVGGTVASGGANDGWISDTNPWAYSGADGATGTVVITGDLTGSIQAGDRIGITQTTPKYFLVSKTPTVASGTTTLVMWGGTDYTLANAAITSPKYSHVKIPFGFNSAPEKWTTRATDTSNRAQASALATTWYPFTGCSLEVPIGSWIIKVKAIGDVADASTNELGFYATLSNTNNSETLVRTTIFLYANYTAAVQANIRTYLPFILYPYQLDLTTKATHYLLLKPYADSDPLGVRGDLGNTVIEATSAYL